VAIIIIVIIIIISSSSSTGSSTGSSRRGIMISGIKLVLLCTHTLFLNYFAYIFNRKRFNGISFHSVKT